MDATRTPPTQPPAPQSAAARPVDPRSTARRRKRQAVAGSLVAFGATWALVLSNPVASAPATTAGADPATGSTTGSAVGPAATSSAGQPAPSFFAPNRGGANQAPVSNLRSGNRSGSLRSGGS